MHSIYNENTQTVTSKEGLRAAIQILQCTYWNFITIGYCSGFSSEGSVRKMRVIILAQSLSLQDKKWKELSLPC